MERYFSRQGFPNQRVYNPPYPHQDVVRTVEETHDSEEQDAADNQDESAKQEKAMIKVTNIPPEASEDSLMFFFENRRKSGGGPVEEVEYDADTQSAVITFEDPEVVDRVLEKLPILFNGRKIDIEKFQPELQSEEKNSDDELDTVYTIEVTGVKAETSPDIVEVYFGNTRFSGGGEVLKLELKDGVYFITFESAEVMQAVLRKKHKIDGANITVKKYIPPPPAKPVPMYTNKAFIKSISSKTSKSVLENFLEAKTGKTPSHIEYGEEEGTALVTFEGDLDFERLQLACQKRSLDKSRLIVSKVPITNCVIIRNISPNTSEDTLEFYFDNKRRSGVTDVLDVKMFGDFCLVYFEDPKAVDVVCERTHKLDGQVLDVRIYYHCIDQVSSQEEGPFKPGWRRYLEASQMKVSSAKKNLEEEQEDLSIKCAGIDNISQQLAVSEVSEETMIIDPMAQDLVRCDLCTGKDRKSPVEMVCKTCVVNLCSECVGKHISAELSIKHNVVGFKFRKSETHSVLCSVHSNLKCKVQCQNCSVPVCAKCLVIGTHKNHDLVEISSVIKSKKEVIMKDTEELKTVTVPTYEKMDADLEIRKKKVPENYANLKTSILKLGKEWHDEVDVIINKNLTLAEKMEKEDLDLLTDLQSEIRKLLLMVQETIHVNLKLEGTEILNYQSRNEEFRRVPLTFDISPPTFEPRPIEKEELCQKFGLIKPSTKTEIPGYTIQIPPVSSASNRSFPDQHTIVNTVPCTLQARVCCVPSAEELYISKGDTVQHLDNKGTV